MLLLVSALLTSFFLCMKVILFVAVSLSSSSSSQLPVSENINMGYVSADVETAYGREGFNSNSVSS